MKRHFFPQQQKTGQAGFTLVELMVSLTLFVIVVTAAVSSLYSVNNALRKIQAMRTVLDNLNFAMENMSRNIRTGQNIVCGGTDNSAYSLPGTASASHSCAFNDLSTSPSEKILLDSTLGEDFQVEYWLDVNANGNGEIRRHTRPTVNDNWSSPVAITAPEIDVDRLLFYVDGADSDDGMRPSVTMFMSGVAAAGTNNTAPFAIQTLISQRNIE